MKKFKLFGFRSNITYKKIIASIYLAFIALLTVVVISGLGNSQSPLGELILLSSFIVPYLLMSNILGLREKLPLYRSEKVFPKIVGIILTMLVLMLIATFFLDPSEQESGIETGVPSSMIENNSGTSDSGSDKIEESVAQEEVTVDYEIINTSTYVRDGKECTAYRVVVSDETTEEEMRNIFEEIVANDSTFLRTVWFYGLESDIDDVGGYTVGMLEELDEDEKNSNNPTFTESNYTEEDIEYFRENAQNAIVFTTPFEEKINEIIKNNNGQIESIETIAAENGEEDSVVLALSCENNETVVNAILEGIKDEILSNDTSESIIVTFADIDEVYETAQVMVLASIMADGTIDISMTGAHYKSERNVWISSQFGIWDGAHTQLEEIIIQNLNDENSYEHIETTYIDVTTQEIKDEVNKILSDANYSNTVEIGDLLITTEFSAKNAFNATIKNTAIGISSFEYQTITLVAIE